MQGEIVGNFRLVSQLGEGGMGEVWLAEHKDILTKVAVKLLQPHISADTNQVKRFFNEAIAAGKIKHAGITRISDVGYHAASGRAYLVMELLDGEPLARRIQRVGRLPFPQLVELARQIASVLEATHAAEIIHRDLKPDNIFVVPDAELVMGERIKVLDFGIAKLADAGSRGMTGTSNAMGTPAYMSPEQWRSSGSVDSRADLYSLGCVVYEMASGHPPYQASSIGEACDRHLNAEIPSLIAEGIDVPPELDALVRSLMAKKADDRPTIGAVRAAFATLSGTPTASIPVASPLSTLDGSAGSMSTVAKPKRRAWPYAVAATVSLAGIAIATVAVTRHGARDESGTVAATPTTPAPTPPPATSTPAPPPSTPPAAAPVATTPTAKPKFHLHLTTTPANAVVKIDGATVDNPFDGAFERDGLNHRIEISAAGFRDDSRMIAFGDDRQLAIALDAVKPTGKPVAAAPAHPVVTPAAPVTSTTPPPTTAAATPPPPANPPPATTTPPANGVYRGTEGSIITTYPPTGGSH